MTFDLKKLNEAIKFLADINGLTIAEFLNSKKIPLQIVYYLKKRVKRSPTLYQAEKLIKGLGLNPGSFVFTNSKTSMKFNPITDVLNPNKLVNANNLKRFFKNIAYSYGDYSMSLSFIHRYLISQFKDLDFDLTIYGDGKHACIKCTLSKDHNISLYINFRWWQNKIYCCISDHSIPVAQLNTVAYDALDYKLLHKYVKLVDFNLMNILD